MRLRRGLQVLNWIWADLFYLVVLNVSFSSCDPLGWIIFVQGSVFKAI